MASNGLSARRGPLRRPKVCLTHKNPGRCEPPIVPQPTLCEIDPTETELTWGMPTDVRFYAVANSYPAPTEIIVTTSVNCGVFTPPSVIFDDQDAVGGYIAPNFDCLAVLTAVFTWPNGEQCTATANIRVIF